MRNISGSEVRRLYQSFFAERGHLVLPSASLVPHDDPTLLWIGAGMAPFKSYFDGREIPEKPRIVSSQKCIRTNDIENVGRTARHQTFFEMLGNFSFGDYFKREAITWAWEFLTKYLELNPELLTVTVHINDDEAYAIWNEEVGIPAHRIVRGKEDNFWEIGEGPCGPCSEIFYDRGTEFGCSSASCQVGCDCDRFLEIWNLVFTQYNREMDGSYTPLPKKNIDTGMGLERVTSILQDVPNNFETDLFKPLIHETARLSGAKYGVNAQDDIHFKIIADHVRTVTFSVGDGVLPGNEGRNYIIRRLLRRAVRSGRRLGVDKAFLFQLVPVVVQIMDGSYPLIHDGLDFITKVVKTEEERFHETLVDGEALLLTVLTKLRAEGQTELSGEDAFRLYDTFGFPIDLTDEIALEQGMTVNREAFMAHLEAQRVRARSARTVAEGMNADRGELETFTASSHFVGYDSLSAETELIGLLEGGEWVDSLAAGRTGQVFLRETPFYAESGGQVADVGTLVSGEVMARVEEVQKAPHGQPVHHVVVIEGVLKIGDQVQAQVDGTLRRDTVKNHTATHLLHKALREVLGTHVAQAGSRVSPDSLRFDFSHFGALSAAELADVERRVNDAIWRDDVVVIDEMDIDAAKGLGAMALFGEKYGHRVRVVQAGDYSIELCGGCHVDRTGIIGMFRIVSETGIGSGVRRIEAVTGRHAYTHVCEEQGILAQTANLLKTSSLELPERLTRVLNEMKGLERELESARAKLSHDKAGQLASAVRLVDDIPVLAAVVTDTDAAGLRQMLDELRVLLPSHVIVLGAASEGRVQLAAAVSKDLQTRKMHAGNLIKRVAEITGGSGGGRPDLAQAGGKDVNALPRAIEMVSDFVRDIAGN